MKIVPVVKCRNMKKSISFYTQVLGFRLKYPIEDLSFPVVDLVQDGIEIQLSVLRGDGVFGSAINIQVDDVDELFKTFIANGLNTSGKEQSPVHQSPLNQTWGMREFYVDDPDGNTLRFRKEI